MLGEDILVAPIMEKKTRKRDVFFPGDIKWANIWSGRKIEKKSGKHGGEWEKDHEAKIGFPPVYCRVGSEICSTFLNNDN